MPKLNHRIKKTQAGASMIELISVLAIMAVLTIGIVISYQYLMNWQLADALYNDMKIRLALSNESKERMFSTELGKKTTYDLDITLQRDEPVKGYNLVTTQGVKKAICSLLLDKAWPEDSRIYINGEVYPQHIAKCPSGLSSFAVAARSARAGSASLPGICDTDIQCEVNELCTRGECWPFPCPEDKICVKSCEEDDCEAVTCEENRICRVNDVTDGTPTQCPCTCPEHRLMSDGVCSNLCERTPWHQPVLTANSGEGYGTVSANSVYASYHEAYYAFNGVKTGGDKYLGRNNADPVEVTWVLPTKIYLSSVKVYTTYEQSYLYRFPRSITVYGSNNGSNWTELGSLSGYSQPAKGAYVVIPCNDSVAYDRVKFRLSGKFAGTLIGVQEIEMTATYDWDYAYNDESFQCEEIVGDYGGSECHTDKEGRVCCNQEEGYSYLCQDGSLSRHSTCTASQTKLWNTSCEQLNEPLACGADGQGEACPNMGGTCVADGEEPPSYVCCSNITNLDENDYSATCCSALIAEYENEYGGNNVVDNTSSYSVGYYDNSWNWYDWNGVPIEQGLCCYNAYDLASGEVNQICGAITTNALSNQGYMWCNNSGLYNGAYCCDGTDISDPYWSPSENCCNFVSDRGGSPYGSVNWISNEYGSYYCCDGPYDVGGGYYVSDACCRNMGGESIYYSDWGSNVCCIGSEDATNPGYGSQACCSNMGGEIRWVDIYYDWGDWQEGRDVCFDSTTECPISYEACNQIGGNYGCAWNSDSNMCERTSVCTSEGDSCEVNGNMGTCQQNWDTYVPECCSGPINLETDTVSTACCSATVSERNSYGYSEIDNNSYYSFDYYDNERGEQIYWSGVPIEEGLCCYNAYDLVSDQINQTCGRIASSIIKNWSWCEPEGEYNGAYCCGGMDLSSQYLGQATENCCNFAGSQGYSSYGSVSWISDEYGSYYCCDGPYDVGGGHYVSDACCRNIGGESIYYNDWSSNVCCIGSEDATNPGYGSQACCSNIGGVLQWIDTYYDWGDWQEGRDVCFEPSTNCPISYDACYQIGANYGCAWNDEQGVCACADDNLCCPMEHEICSLNAVIDGTASQCPCICPDDRNIEEGICTNCKDQPAFVVSPWSRPNLTKNSGQGYGTVTCSSRHSTDEDCWRAFDNLTYKHYLSAYGTSAWITWHLPVSLKVRSTTLYQNSNEPSSNRFPKKITIYGSNDGSNWTQIGTITNTTIPNPSTTINTNSSQAWEYLKWQFTGNYGGLFIQVGQILIDADQIAQTGEPEPYTYNSSTGKCERAQ